MGFSGFAQKQKFTEEDARQFYHTMQGDYTVIVNDTTTASAHFTPIWENAGNPYQWLYVEVTLGDTVILQKVRPAPDELIVRVGDDHQLVEVLQMEFI